MRSLINFTLLVTALLLAIVLFPAGVLFTFFSAIQLRSFRKMIGYWSNSALTTALSIDIMGNVVCRDLLNWAAIQGPDRYLFGNYQETISSVLGKNKALGTLTRRGRWLAGLLNTLDKNHVEHAVKVIIS